MITPLSEKIALFLKHEIIYETYCTLYIHVYSLGFGQITPCMQNVIQIIYISSPLEGKPIYLTIGFTWLTTKIHKYTEFCTEPK